MAVDLSDKANSLRRAVNAPGLSQVTMTDQEATNYLSDAFWTAVLDGVITGYTESDGIVTPSSGTTDLSGELQQLIVFYAGYNIVLNQLRDIKTVFSAKSGDNQYEVQQAATLLKAVLDDLKAQRDHILFILSQYSNLPTYVLDNLTERDYSLTYDYTYWAT